MVTNDVASLTPGTGCYTFVLDATGHVLADMRVLCTESSLLLDLEPGTAAFVAATLDKYLIMEKCRITDATDDTRQLFFGGREVVQKLAEYGLTEAGAWTEGQNATVEIVGVPCLVAATRLIPGPGFDLYISANDTADASDAVRRVQEALGAVALTPDVLEPLRVEAGIPRFGVDMDSRVLAPETGQQKRAISYRKGCYIGQEIVARIDARGRVNRGFAGFRLTTENLPDPETPVLIDGKEVGRITSAAIGPTLGIPLALGYIRREHAGAVIESGTIVTIADAPATVAELPFAPAQESGLETAENA
jgi:folate-binding protein YgfZ